MNGGIHSGIGRMQRWQKQCIGVVRHSFPLVAYFQNSFAMPISLSGSSHFDGLDIIGLIQFVSLHHQS